MQKYNNNNEIIIIMWYNIPTHFDAYINGKNKWFHIFISFLLIKFHSTFPFLIKHYHIMFIF